MLTGAVSELYGNYEKLIHDAKAKTWNLTCHCTDSDIHRVTERGCPLHYFMKLLTIQNPNKAIPDEIKHLWVLRGFVLGTKLIVYSFCTYWLAFVMFKKNLIINLKKCYSYHIMKCWQNCQQKFLCVAKLFVLQFSSHL